MSRQVLGKGIGSLIKNTSKSALLENYELDQKLSKKVTEASSSSYDLNSGVMQIPVEKIKINKNQPRKIFKEKELAELATSIKENGIIQPLTAVADGSGFELIAGERRLRAAKMAGLSLVPVIVKKVTDKEKSVIAIIENVQRSDLNCIEEALAYYQLMEEFDLTQEEVSKKVGKERSTIANFLRVLKLPRKVVDLLQKELISFGYAKILASVKDETLILKLADEVANEGISVRELEKRIKDKTTTFSENKEARAKLNLSNLEKDIERKTGFKAKINSNQNYKGKLVVSFDSKTQIDKLYELLMRS